MNRASSQLSSGQRPENVLRRRGIFAKSLLCAFTAVTAVVVCRLVVEMQAIFREDSLNDVRAFDFHFGIPDRWDSTTFIMNKTTIDSSFSKNTSFGSPRNIPKSNSLFKMKVPEQLQRKWAYAFLVGGCDPDRPGYRGFLYNVLMATRRLRSLGSTSDFVVMIQMSFQSRHRRLPEEEEKMIDDLGIIIKYIPAFASATHEVFYALMMEKFRVLALTEYSRVIFLDSDQWPLCNLDYLFELSEPKPGKFAILKPNLLLAWKLEPCNGGFFMVAPKEGDFEHIQRIIRAREREALAMNYPYWNATVGWGHEFSQRDKWVPSVQRTNTMKNTRTKNLEWGWHGAFADQGLIYYWTKYVKKDVSIIINDRVQRWGDCKGVACLERREKPNLRQFSCSGGGLQRDTTAHVQYSPYRDIYHLSGRNKPWVHDPEKKTHVKTTWFKELQELQKELFGGGAGSFSLEKEVGNLLKQRKPASVGSYPVNVEMFRHVQDMAARNWNPYLNATTDAFLSL